MSAFKCIGWRFLHFRDHFVATLDRIHLHDHLYFQLPGPVFELYDLQEDPFQLKNLAGSKETAGIEKELRMQLDRLMVRESDFLPLPSDVRER